jgi:flagellar hook-basal body complex protein FliE
MNVGGIDGGRIESMLAQLRQAAGAARPAGLESPLPGKTEAVGVPKLDFAAALKDQLDSVAKLQSKSEQLEKDFQLGDDKVNLSDVMIAGQKAGIAFQATLQVRNKLVAAYHDVMNMQV